VEPPIIDNEPTPFAPAVALEHAQQLGSELERLRSRHALVNAPDGRDTLLERLRQRARHG